MESYEKLLRSSWKEDGGKEELSAVQHLECRLMGLQQELTQQYKSKALAYELQEKNTELQKELQAKCADIEALK